MRYMLLFHYPEESEETIGIGAVAAAMREMAAYAGTLQQAGVLVTGQVLQPASSTTTLSLVEGRCAPRTARSLTPRSSSAA